jgi:hypothetical protein
MMIRTAYAEIQEEERRALPRRALYGKLAVALPSGTIISGRAYDINVSCVSAIFEMEVPIAVACKVAFMLPDSAGMLQRVDLLAYTQLGSLSRSLGGFKLVLRLLDVPSDIKNRMLAYIAG